MYANSDAGPAADCCTVPITSTFSDIDFTAAFAPLWDDVDDSLPQNAKDRLKRLLVDHLGAFSDVWDLGFTDILEHRIDTGNETPVRQAI